MDDPESVVLCGIFVENGPTVVRAAVVDADAFPVCKCLRQNAVKAVAQIGCDVVDRNDDGKGRHRKGLEKGQWTPAARIASVTRRQLSKRLEGIEFKAAILPDHPTPIDIGTHTRDDVPIIMYSSTRDGDECESFDEQGVLKGSVEKKEGYKLMERLIDDDF